MEETSDIQLTEVFSGEQWQAKMIQNILVDNQIPAFIKNELMGQIEPWAVTAGGYHPVAVSVSGQNYDAAVKLIEEFNNSATLTEEE